MSYRVDITITNPDGQQVTLSQAFDFVQAPQLLSVSPSSGPEAGGTSVTLTGKNIQPGAKVLFGDKPALGVTVSPDGTTATVITPSMV